MRRAQYRPTWVEVNLEALRWNVQQIRQCIPPATRILAQVKSDAYGHGLVPVATELAACGVDYLGIVSLDEASTLRDAGCTQPLLVQSVLAPDDAPAVIELDVWPTVCTREFARALQQAAQARHRRIAVHLKVDTGMGRLGVWHEETEAFLAALADCDALQWDGCYTQLPSADDDPAFTREQLAVFTRCVEQLRACGYPLPLVHAANSMGVMSYPESHGAVVRPGLMVYGLAPSETMQLPIPLEPVLQWNSRIIFLKHVPAGRTISYGRTYTTPRATTIATIPVGYGDGYRRALSNRGRVLVHGQAVPIVGRVCMDHLMMDVGSVPHVAIGDEVVVMGRQGEAQVTAEELARAMDTIPYEIVTAITERVPRHYVRQPIAARQLLTTLRA